MSGGAGDGPWVLLPQPLPPRGAVRGLEVDGHSLVVCNVEGTPYAIASQCPHGRVDLGAGALRGCVLECPLHGGKLDVRDGTPLHPPIRAAVRTYAVRRRGETWEVQLG